MGQRYRKMEDQKQKPGLPCSQDFSKVGQGLEPRLKKFSKNCKLGEMASSLNLCNLNNVSQTRVWGQSPPLLGDFL